MITICPKCRSHKWNKEVDMNMIICPQCGEKWSYIKKPIFILTGCSLPATPKLDTFLKILHPLGLKLTISK